MARAGGGGDSMEPRRRRERSRSREEIEAGESTSIITGMGNRHPVSLDGEGMRRAWGVGILGGRDTDDANRSGESTSIRPDVLRRALSKKDGRSEETE
jgi:hypothetical protein